MPTNPDGYISFLKPYSNDWKPLDNESFSFWRDRIANTALELAGEAPIEKRELDESEKKELKDNQSYIQDLLLKSLQFPHLSFFAGSGTSLGVVGGPSMWDLWRYSMLDNPEETGSGEISEIAKAVCEKVKYFETENPNIEHFLSNCESYLTFHDDMEVSNFLYKVRGIILDKCHSFIKDERSDLSSYRNLLQKMARRRARDPRLKVFTTNYDLTFESSASELGMMVIDGLSYTGKRRFDGKYFNYDVVKRNDNEHDFVEGVFQLLKLHGSVSWMRKENQVYEDLNASAENACLIYPAKGKYQQAFIQPHLELLSRFLDSLRKENNCLVISGFGFNDDHLSEPIYSAVKSNPSMKLIIVDFKCASHINNSGTNGSSKYWSLLKELSTSGYDIHFINSSFSDFVNIIPNLKALTPAEQLAKVMRKIDKDTIMLNLLFERGILRNELKLGLISSIFAQVAKVNLIHAGDLSGSYLDGNRYGKGEVGEIVLIEGQQSIVLGRLIEVKLPERDRNEVSEEHKGKFKIDSIGTIQLLGTVNPSSLRIESGIKHYPRLGDKVYSTPIDFISLIPELINKDIEDTGDTIGISLGTISGGVSSFIKVDPDKLFGRHCAILGATGGGKSWTTSKIIEECSKYKNSKVIIIDATSEYRSFVSQHCSHYHLGDPLKKHHESVEFRIPPTDFVESDFIAIFDPSGKVQGPKLKEAIKSLRLVKLDPTIGKDGILVKRMQSKKDYRKALNFGDNAKLVDNPSQPFDVTKLVKQIVQECSYDGGEDSWGNTQSNDLGYCSSLLTRILAVTHSSSLKSVFQENDKINTLGNVLKEFLAGDKRILRLCLSNVSYEFFAREILANVIGRKLLTLARMEEFREKPLLAIVDEAHNFLGKRVGSEDHSIKLDAFEIIAKEGRKYGLNICLSTQRPRDITEGVLSQIGTLLVHRLTNDKDREVVERACGEIDKSAASFLPSLKQGEIALVGVDFPIPMTIQIGKPTYPPESDSPGYKKIWSSK